MLGDGGRVYASYGRQIAAMNYLEGTVICQWTSPTVTDRLELVASEQDHEIVVKIVAATGTENLMRVDASGNRVMGTFASRDLQHYWENQWLNINAPWLAFEVIKGSVLRYNGSARMDPTQWRTNRAPTHGLIVVTGFSRSPSQQTDIAAVFAQMKTALNVPANSACKTWTQSGTAPDIGAEIQTQINLNLFGHGSYEVRTAAFVGIGALGIPADVTITVNRDGMFFHQKASNDLNFKFLGKRRIPARH